MDMQATHSPAEVYERKFVPALFQHWACFIAASSGIRPGQCVLDVACGTGVLACASSELAGESGAVTGLDCNDAMLDVARRKDPCIAWVNGRAESLPFEDRHFDHVVSQFGLMFFADQTRALAEMMRVLRPGGKMTVAVCDALDHSPGYAVLAELLQRLFGEEVARCFRAPFASGDRDQLLSLCANAGIPHATVRRHDGPVRFPSIHWLVAAEHACAWTLGGLLDEAQFKRLYREAEETFQPFLTPQGEVEFNMPALIIAATR